MVLVASTDEFIVTQGLQKDLKYLRTMHGDIDWLVKLVLTSLMLSPNYVDKFVCNKWF